MGVGKNFCCRGFTILLLTWKFHQQLKYSKVTKYTKNCQQIQVNKSWELSMHWLAMSSSKLYIVLKKPPEPP